MHKQSIARRGLFISAIFGILGPWCLTSVLAHSLEAVNAELETLDRLIAEIEQRMAAMSPASGTTSPPSSPPITSPPPSQVPAPPGGTPATTVPKPPVEIAKTEAPQRFTCEDTIKSLQQSLDEAQQRFSGIQKTITAANKQVRQLVHQIREAEYECDDRLLADIDNFIQEVSDLPMSSELDQVIHINLCIGLRGDEIESKLKDQNLSPPMLNKLTKRKGRVTQITSASTDLWQEYENCISKQQRLIDEAKENREVCAF